MGGLAAAARLAKRGHHVTVLEQAPTVGGKLGRFARDGHVFDTGPSLLTLPAVYRDTFRKSGRPLEREIDLVPVDPAFRYHWADGSRVDLPNASPGGVRRALDAALGSGAGEQWQTLMGRAGAVWDLTRGPFLTSPLEGASTLLRLARDTRDVATVAPFTSLRRLGIRYLDDPRLRMLLDRYATYAGSDPRRAPAALVTIPYVEQAFGAWHVPGGLRRLGDALAERVRLRGATVRTGADVTQIAVRDGRVTGVVLADGTRVDAEVVVANVDAWHVYHQLLPGAAGRSGRRRLARVTPSFSGFSLLLALRGRTPDARHHTVLFPADYDAEFDVLFPSRGRPAVPVPDPTIYVCNPDDDAMRPLDGESWFVLVNAPRHGTDAAPGTLDWTAPGLADRYADHVLALLAARGLDVRDRLRWRVVRTPADLERETRAPGGAIYGSSSNGPRAAFLRPANRSDIGGLYLVGGSAHPGGGLPLVGLSAAIVADLIGDAPRRAQPERAAPAG